jgi:DNA-binding CsgD family transcriptional regulator
LRPVDAGRMFAEMEALHSRDLRAALEFVETAWSLADERAFALQTLVALGVLIQADAIAYCELDRAHQCELDYVATDQDEHGDDELELFWRIVEDHPLCRHQQAYADFSANRLSDVISRRSLLNSPIYADWFRPSGIEAELEIGITRSRTRTRNFILDRAGSDFSPRDRAVLELVRPHLGRIHEMAQLRSAVGVPMPEDLHQLTAREAEVLELVAAGLTNAAIAERLWISPGTVKKHLENVYSKLGVDNRTAAVARVTRH